MLTWVALFMCVQTEKNYMTPFAPRVANSHEIMRNYKKETAGTRNVFIETRKSCSNRNKIHNQHIIPLNLLMKKTRDGKADAQGDWSVTAQPTRFQEIRKGASER